MGLEGGHAEAIMCDAPMVAEAVRLRPGVAAARWLIDRISAIQAVDPLEPVTVVVPAHHAGVHLRHLLARQRYANVRFTILPRVAESLGAARLADRGWAPLTATVRSALMRRALREAGPPLGSGAEQAGLVDLLTRLAAELRRRPDPAGDRERIRRAGIATSAAAIGVIADYERLRTAARLHDDVDLLEAAAAAASDGAADRLLLDLGTVIVHLPHRLDAPDLLLLRALAGRRRVVVTVPDPGGDLAVEVSALTAGPLASPAPAALAVPPARMTALIAPDPVAEVRAAVRDAVAALERDHPVALHRTAVVYRDEETYGRLLRDTLDEAGVPFAALDGRPLIESVPARGLLGLVRLREQDFARPAVLAWLSGLPHQEGVLRSQARWDQLSRDAGVVRGAAQWRDRLTAFAGSRRRILDGLEADPEDPTVEAHRAALLREIADARRIVEHVSAIESVTTPPAGRTWEAHVAWALRLRDEFLTPDGGWSAEDREASQAVEEVVRGLAAARLVEPDVSVGVFLRALEDGLRARRRPEGRFGGGVIVGPHHLLLGIDVDRLQVLGAVEAAFPAAMPVDPLLPGDPLERRRTGELEERRVWLATLAAADGGEAVVSAPAVDAEGRAVYPSPWLLELLGGEGTRPRASDVRLGTVEHAGLRRVGGAGAAAVMRTTPLSLAERREAEAAAAHAAGRSLPASALARRLDLPLGRALTVNRARRSSQLTEFDGDVAAVAGLPLIAGGLSTSAQSATGIETWATCPFHHLLGRVLRVRPTEDVEDERWWQIDPAERGTLIHDILERFFSEVAAGGRPAPGEEYSDADVSRMEEIAAAAFFDAEVGGITGHRLVWANERAAILADLRTLLREDAEQRAGVGWRPQHLEQPFGAEQDPRSWPALAIPLGDGRRVLVRGYIDRVDVDGCGGARVIDYKTGSNHRPAVGRETRFDAGRKLQLPVYGRVVRDHARAQGAAVPATQALYWYATVKGGFSRVSLTVDEAAEDMLADVLTRIDAGIRAGCFPQVPGDYQDYNGRYANCAFCDYDTLCPAGRDVLAAAKADSPPLHPYRALQPDAGGQAG